MLRILIRFFDDLFAGDPVAVTVALILLGIILFFGLLWLKAARDLRREDEERNAWRRKGKKSKK